MTTLSLVAASGAAAVTIPRDVTGATTMVSEFSARADARTALQATVTVENGSSAALTDAFLVMSVTDDPLDSTEDLSDFLSDTSAFDMTEVARTPEPADTSGDDEGSDADSASDSEAVEGDTIPARQSVSMSATASDLDLPDESAVYGVTLTVETEQGDIAVDALPMTWTGARLPSVDMALLATASSTQTAVAQTLNAVTDTSASVAVDPTLLTDSMVFGAGLYEREVVWLPGGSPDLVSLAHAGDTRLLDFSLTQRPYSSLAASMDLPWVAPVAALDGTTASMAAEAGAIAILPDARTSNIGDLREQAGSASVVAVETSEGDLPVLIPHEALTGAVATFRPGTEAQWARVVAETAFAAKAGDPVLVAPGDEWLRTPDTAALLNGLLELPWVNPVTVQSLADSSDMTTISVPDVLDEDADLPASTVEKLGDQLPELSVLSEATINPREAYDTWGAVVLSGVPASGRQSPDGRQLRVQEVLAETADTLAGVSIASSSDLNLLADDGDVPVTVVNSLDWPVTVTVVLESNSPNLIVEDKPSIEVPAGESRQALVNVSAVSSANVDMSVHLEREDGERLSADQAFSIRVRAEWGTAATAIFTVFLVLLLIAGIIRTIRRGRKDTRTADVPLSAEMPVAAHDDAEGTPEDNSTSEQTTKDRTDD
ncbi:DUF6049 family protein [Demequina sp. B12]|uniref:DUF6049 family protein n=1 Tax=Demequina sp. B12 TaxID=2992757 RepID=UPI00237B7C2F|nr:DUF6049 family protein [Demequina sp. B12]MDE0572140.1 DUF6049 family protein [Demequina sp. B12]